MNQKNTERNSNSNSVNNSSVINNFPNNDTSSKEDTHTGKGNLKRRSDKQEEDNKRIK